MAIAITKLYCRTQRKQISLSIAHQVTQTSIPPKELVCYEKETQTATELADKEGKLIVYIVIESSVLESTATVDSSTI